jgi:hypothetical protein
LTNVARVRHFARFRPDVPQTIVDYFRPQAEAALDFIDAAALQAAEHRKGILQILQALGLLRPALLELHEPIDFLLKLILTLGQRIQLGLGDD